MAFTSQQCGDLNNVGDNVIMMKIFLNCRFLCTKPGSQKNVSDTET